MSGYVSVGTDFVFALRGLVLAFIAECSHLRGKRALVGRYIFVGKGLRFALRCLVLRSMQDVTHQRPRHGFWCLVSGLLHRCGGHVHRDTAPVMSCTC